nr:MAG TPA: Tail tape measure [Caudoviricetes sp.]
MKDAFSGTYAKYLNYTDKANTATSRLTSTLKSLAGAYIGLQGLKTLVNLADTMTGINARLEMMNDNLQTTAELNEMIYQSAQRSRGSYIDTANTVAKLGTLAKNAFSSSQEIVAFAEQLNKQIALSGASAGAAQGALLQLTQALSSGVLRGDELNSVMEQTPTITQSIAEYLGVSVGEMRELASQGKITSDVVKAALFSTADETNQKFESMPMTWTQVFNMFKNIAIRALQPVLTAISWLANNIEIVGPLVLGLAGAFAVFQIAAHWTEIAAVVTGAYNAVVNLLSIGYGVLTGSTAAASAATFTFNSALLANPITWVVMGIMLLVGALYAGVAAYNHFTGASVSATGIIMGVMYTLGAFVYNIIAEMWNQFAVFANFIGNVFNNPIAAVKVAFYDMAITVLGYLQSIASGIENLLNKIPGVQVDITSGIGNLIDNFSAKAESAKSEGEWKEYVKSMDYKDLTSAYNKGYDKGSNLKLFGSGIGGGGFDYSQFSTTLDGMGGDLGSIKGSAAKIAKDVDMSKEDVKSLVDMATRQYVNKINLNSQTPIITVNGANTGNTEADRKALANTIKDIIIEQAASSSFRPTAMPI